MTLGGDEMTTRHIEDTVDYGTQEHGHVQGSIAADRPRRVIRWPARLQLQKEAVSGDVENLPKYRGMLGTVSTIAREEGLAILWKGIVPGLHRQCVFGGLRIGLCEPVKSLYVGENFVGDIPLTKKILAGLTTGAIAITVANPTDLVKVRLQAEGKLFEES
ncbi:mitochondrial uncoupling protein 1-like [Asparagus officinalis]|uniref:mitochondrial uncoupling protein 1-like n=1 Tax=Asparagus officinalis TaxID=4686 RepID=UPI00098DF6B2|nr:mitochondrial uncoupling protein 1-like [Asparagus officinalis]